MTEGSFEIQELLKDIGFLMSKTLTEIKTLKRSIFFSLVGCFQIPFFMLQ